jgi:hypothetical protein
VTFESRAVRDGAALFGLCAWKALLAAWLVHIGFSHVSDDDYARTVIAEQLVHAPRLDPSGTSWLPFPFWITGAAMALFGRSIGVARAVAIALGVVATAAPWTVLRRMGVARWAAVLACVLAMATPWNVWLGAAAVPEAFVGALVAAGALACSADASPGVRAWGAAALLVASLSRYEAWPACAVLAVVCARDALRGRRVAMLAVALAVLGPAMWMAWNFQAHGSATHFLARVSAYRRAVGAAEIPLEGKLLGYPLALATSAPHLLALAALGAAGLAEPAFRARWAGPLLALSALVGFLVVGDVRDGAPTHHAERALAAAFWLLAAFGADGAHAVVRRFAWARSRREMFIVGGAAAFAVTWLASVPLSWGEYPGAGAEEVRDTQIARGVALREHGANALDVTPCAYEHFALLAAFGAPERATVETATHAPVTDVCPAVTVR